MRFLDLFSGIGGFRLGLEMAGHTCAGHVEIDKYANQSYRAIHQPKEREFFHEDITTITDESIRELRDRGIDIIAGGFPCQAFSIAGKRAGFEDTRGTLFFDIAKLAREIQPKYLFLENVKGLLNHNRGDTFEVILRTLDELGYDAEWQVLNSKHFGVPQNRERVFIIGHLRGRGGRKVFPITGDGKQVDDEFKINQIGNLIDTESFGGNPQGGRVYRIDGISPCLNTMGGGGLEPKIAININRGKISCQKDNTSTCLDANYFKGLDNHGARTGVMAVSYDRTKGIGDEIEVAHCLNSSDWRGLNRNQKQNAVVVPAVLRPVRTDYGKKIRKQYESGEIEESRHNMTRLEPRDDEISNTITTVQKDNLLLDQRYIDGISDKHSFAKKKAQGMLNESGELPERFNPYNAQEIDEVSPTLTANCDRSTNSSTVLMKQPNFRIRKLTPKECWRLQGFPDWAFERARAVGVSDSQLYKQAGNSVTVNVVYEIAKRLR